LGGIAEDGSPGHFSSFPRNEEKGGLKLWRFEDQKPVVPFNSPLTHNLRRARAREQGQHNASRRVKNATMGGTLKNDGTFDGTFQNRFSKT